ncbi:MAG: hypothetical protein N2C14_16000 [Planctomycetales bacterium]
MTNTDSNACKLHWRAFQYVSGEMNPAEQDDFETELFDQQPAREAVAQIVELSQAVALACPATRRPAKRKFSAHAVRKFLAPVSWMSLGAAACLVCVLALRSSPADGSIAAGGSDSSPVASAEKQAEQEALARTLLDSQSGVREALGWNPSPPIDAVGAGVGSDEIESDVAVPGWMLAAVCNSENGKSPAVEKK